MDKVKHAMAARSGGEFTMCGVAFDAFESGDADEPVVFAKVNQVITCPDCRAQIDYAKMAFTTGYCVREDG